MSRRARAIAFGLAALVAAIAAGAIADGYGDSVARGYGALRPVVVASAQLPAGKALDPTGAEDDLEVRQVPARFVPAGALRDPAEALGLVPAAAIPSGAYLLAAQLRPPRSEQPGPRLAAGRRPVADRGQRRRSAGASAAPIRSARGSTSSSPPNPGDGGTGRTYVAAAAVPLLGLGAGPEGDVAGAAEATLGLTRPQALRLIAAESFARQVTVMPARRTMSARERHIAEARRDPARPAGRAPPRRGGGGPARPPTSSGRCASWSTRRRRSSPAADRAEIAARVVRDSVGLGPLEILLADPLVEEVMVNGPDRVFVERAGRIEPTAIGFADEEELRNAIERILAPLGRRVDELSPMVDARLADGSRVNVVIPPLAIDGPAISIRRFGAERPGPDRLVELGTLDPEQRAPARGGGAGAAQHPGQRRHRLG